MTLQSLPKTAVGFFIFSFKDFKLHNNRGIFHIFRLHYDIVTSKPGFPVGLHHVLICLIYQQTQYKTMVKPLRFFLFRRLLSGVKVTEGIQCNLIHVMVHGTDIATEHGCDKFIEFRSSFKPSFHHPEKHQFHFMVGKG